MKSKANVMVLKAVENQTESRVDWFKWFMVATLVVGGLVANHIYNDISMLWRTLVWLATLGVAGFIASTTQKGKLVLEFVRESRLELRKVVWPTREETVQTTLVVAAMVVILAILLWGMDGVLVWAIGWLTGQHG